MNTLDTLTADELRAFIRWCFAGGYVPCARIVDAWLAHMRRESAAGRRQNDHA